MIQALFEAARFLTIIPLPAKSEKPDMPLAKAMSFFPIVGFLIGLVALAGYQMALGFFTERVAVTLLWVIPIFLSGGLHLDGFADFCDGFFGGATREDKLRIMKDSRLGTWGVAGLIFLILFKFEMLNAMAREIRPLVILSAMTLSRWSQVCLSFFLPYAGNVPGLAEGVARKVEPWDMGIASGIVFLILGGIGTQSFLYFMFMISGLALLYLLFKKTFGGVTGDMLGATSEMSELLIYGLAASNYAN